jgi:hypothetical protein
VVCPLGFWGLSRILEHREDGALPGVRRLDILDAATVAGWLVSTRAGSR